MTHDQEEVLDRADRIIVINEEKIKQIGSPEEVYEHPNNPLECDFLGNVNVFHGQLEDGKGRNGADSEHTDQFLEAELTNERYRELNLKTGETVFVSPNKLNVFIPEDYSI